MPPRFPLASILLATSLAAACHGDDTPFADAGVQPDAAPGTRAETSSRSLDTQLDVLFVIDDSSSMREEQQVLIRNFPDFIAVLENLEGGLPDIHIGVISTDVGAGPFTDASCTLNGNDGSLLIGDDCPIVGSERFLRSAPTASGRDTNFEGTLTAAFGCIADLGVGGCGFERPLESVRRALDGHPDNAGFRRPGAQLAIVFLTDEDDCSALDDTLYTPDETVLGERSSYRCFEYGVTCAESGRGHGERTRCVSNETGPYMAPVASFAQFLKDLGGPGTDDDSSIIVAGIHGLAIDDNRPGPVRVGPEPSGAFDAWLQPVCEREVSASGVSTAAPGVRLAQFFGAFPGRSTEMSICNDDYSGALGGVVDLVKQQRGPDCIVGELADVDRASAGVQIACSVTDVIAPGTADERSIDVPACDAGGGPAPCWRLVTDDAACPTGTHQAVVVERGTTPVPTGTYQRRTCTIVD
jgi:hypothetical protein